MFNFEPWLNDLSITGYINYDLLWMAFTHKSYKGMGHNVEDNERLEFLGDAVLDLITAEILYDDLELSESEMTELRKLYVGNDQLAVVFNKLGMEQFIRTANNLGMSNKIKAGFVEAFFGALYLEKGYQKCLDVWQIIQNRISGIDDRNNDFKFKWEAIAPEGYELKNAKTTLQEFCQSQQFELPEYKVTNRKGPDHNPYYTVKLIIRPGSNKMGFENVFDTYVTDKPYVRTIGEGGNIKLAEMRAAEEMCERIGLAFSSSNYNY